MVNVGKLYNRPRDAMATSLMDPSADTFGFPRLKILPKASTWRSRNLCNATAGAM